MRQQARTSLDVEPGCARIDVCVDPSDPRKVLLYEVSDDAAAFESHQASAHFNEFDEAVAVMIQKNAVRGLRWA